VRVYFQRLELGPLKVAFKASVPLKTREGYHIGFNQN